MKILLNLCLAGVWIWLMYLATFGSTIETKNMAGLMGLVIICIFLAKELIIYEIGKLKK